MFNSKCKYIYFTSDDYNKFFVFQPERVVHQVHLTSWPDHGVPNTVFSLLSFINYVADIQTTGPIVVHCSAGVGRSGSFILIDSMRRHLLHCDHINMYAHLRHIRRQRSHLVQTLEQYVFCHRVVRELIRHGITRQSVPNFPNYLKFLYHQMLPDGRTRLQMQYEVSILLYSITISNILGSLQMPSQSFMQTLTRLLQPSWIPSN